MGVRAEDGIAFDLITASCAGTCAVSGARVAPLSPADDRTRGKVTGFDPQRVLASTFPVRRSLPDPAAL